MEQIGIDDYSRRQVEGADEVLSLVQVDRRLAADRRVDHPDDRRRHGHPGNSSQIARRDEPAHVRCSAAPERHERAAAIEHELVPEPLADGKGLRRLAGRDGVRRGETSAERRSMEGEHVLVGDERNRAFPGHERFKLANRTSSDRDAAGSEQHVLEVGRDDVGCLEIERAPLLEQLPETLLVLGKRPARARDSSPCLVDVDLKECREGLLGQRPPRLGSPDSASSEGEHERLTALEQLPSKLSLLVAKPGLPPLGEHERDLHPVPSLELGVEIDKGALGQPCNLAADGRLAGPHEADERDVAVKRLHAAHRTAAGSLGGAPALVLNQQLTAELHSGADVQTVTVPGVPR